MEQLRKFRKSVLFLCKVIMIGLLVLAFYVIWQVYYNRPSEDTLWWRGSTVMVVLYSSILLAFTAVYGATKIGVLRLSEIIYSFSLALLITDFLMYLQLCLLARAMLPFSHIVQLYILQIWVAAFGAYVVNKLYFALYPARELVIIRPAGDNAQALIRKLKLKRDRYKVCEVISESCPRELLESTIDNYSSILICNIEPNLRQHLFNYCRMHGKRVYLTPTVKDVMVKNSHNTQLFDTPLFYCKNTVMTTEQAFLKRVIDLVIGVLALIAASPFMLLTALCVKLEDRGPIIYAQTRLTLNNREFRVYKFRSMKPDAEKDEAILSPVNDDRVTKVGRIIRKIRFDELPQIFNILRGDMSIVGPRPERPEIAAKYEKVLPEFKLRLEVKAGLTGYAQIYGKYNTTPQDKLLLDLMYIENYSLFLDFKLILMTIKILFMPESTEGIEEGEKLPIHIGTDSGSKEEEPNSTQS